MNETETTANSELELTATTPKIEIEKKTESSLELGQTLNLCQGYKVDPVSKLHLCNSCAYHK
jgi:hypothetical protein